MAHAAKILADSISPDGVRLTTFEVVFPRIILAEFNTHRMFSRNSASSRAIPVKKMLKRVREDPYIPSVWGKNQKGMRAEKEVTPAEAELAKQMWIGARDGAVAQVRLLLDLGIHKQLTNRLLEPWLWHTVIVTATEWDNFFHLRDNKMAHPDIQIPARLMRDLHSENEPTPVDYGQWHLPLVFDADWELAKSLLSRDETEVVDLLAKISCARCARVSYLTHDGKRDLMADLKLYDKLLEQGHMSPFEHAATPMTPSQRDLVFATVEVKDRGMPFCGNYKGWVQHRKLIPGEADIHGETS